MASPFLRLLAEEIRALPRARFALAGAALVLALLTLLAAVPASTMAGGLWAFGFVAFILVPCALAPFVAARVSGARASLFLQAVFTMPMTKARYLAAVVCASLAMGAAYLLATLPLLLVAAAHVDGALLWRFLAAGAAAVAWSVALGTLLGLLFTGRGVGGAVALASAFALASVLGVLYLGWVLAAQDGAAWAVRAAHVSPAVLAMGAGALLPFGLAPSSAARAVAALAAATLALLTLAAWVFLREQSVERWESPPARRVALALAVGLALLAPVAIADATYVPRGEPLSGGVGTSMDGAFAGLAPRGGDAREALFGGAPMSRDERYAVGEPHLRDLVVLLPFAADVTDVRIVLSADPRLRVEPTTEWSFAALPRDEMLQLGENATPLLRIPVVVTPTDPEALGWNVYEIAVNVSFTTADRGPREGSARFPVIADVAEAPVQLALASAPLVLGCAGAAIGRKLRRG